MAARDGLRVDIATGFNKIIMESDSINLISLLNSRDGERSMLASIWHDVQELARQYLSVKISYACREANRVAHECARRVSVSKSQVIWNGSAPNFP